MGNGGGKSVHPQRKSYLCARVRIHVYIYYTCIKRQDSAANRIPKTIYYYPRGEEGRTRPRVANGGGRESGPTPRNVYRHTRRRDDDQRSESRKLGVGHNFRSAAVPSGRSRTSGVSGTRRRAIFTVRNIYVSYIYTYILCVYIYVYARGRAVI